MKQRRIPAESLKQNPRLGSFAASYKGSNGPIEGILVLTSLSVNRDQGLNLNTTPQPVIRVLIKHGAFWSPPYPVVP